MTKNWKGVDLETVDLRHVVGTDITSDSPVAVYCPYHEDKNRPSGALYADGFYCFTCGATENRVDFLTRIEADPEAVRKSVGTLVARPKRGVPDAYLRNAAEQYHRFLTEGPRQHRYEWYVHRGFTFRTINSYLLGHTGERFSIPVWNRNRITGFQFRADPEYVTAGKGVGKYLNLKGANSEIFFINPRGHPLVVTEGPMDALLLAQYGCAALANTTGSGRIAVALAPLLEKRKCYYLFADCDAPGQKAAVQLLTAAPNGYVVDWGGTGDENKDIGEYLLSLPGNERKYAVQSLIRKAK